MNKKLTPLKKELWKPPNVIKNGNGADADIQDMVFQEVYHPIRYSVSASVRSPIFRNIRDTP